MNHIGVWVLSPPSPHSPLLVAFPVLPHITYQLRHFPHLSLPLPSNMHCLPLPTPAYPVSSHPLRFPPLVVPSQSPTPTPVLFIMTWITP